MAHKYMTKSRIVLASICATLNVTSYAQTASQATDAGAPAIVIRSNLHETTVWNHERPGAPANNGSISLGSTTGSGLSGAPVNSTGANVQVNNHTVAQPGTVITAGELPCEPVAKSWTVSGSTCNASLPRTFSRLAGTAVDSLNPTTGQATYTCSNGVWAGTPTTSSCITTTCAAQANYWTASATCGANFPTLNSGQSLTLPSVNGNTGSATFMCNAGSWQLTSNGGCAAPAPPKGCTTQEAATGLNRIPGTQYRLRNQMESGTGYSTGQASGRPVGPDGYPGVGIPNIASGGVMYIGAAMAEQVFARYQCNNGYLTRQSGWIYWNSREAFTSWMHNNRGCIGPHCLGVNGGVWVPDTLYLPN